MARMPAAEVHVDAGLVRRLLSDQHPDLADLPIVELGVGWDNVLMRLGGDLLVRLPRRRLAAPLVENEQRWLPLIAPLVDLAVPLPVQVGRPTSYYPWSWSVLRWVDGTVAALEPVAARSRWARQLATFAAQLHVPAPADAPENPFRGVPLADRDPDVTRRLTTAGIPRGEELLALWRRLLPTPVHAGPPAWVHGDLHPLNLLVDRGRLVSVLDFGDVTAGDPATDLATAWLTFDSDGRAELVVRYAELTGADEHLWSRARGWAVVLASALLESSDDHALLAAVGAHAVAQLLDAPDAV